ncbi:hypothetical protein L249_4812 [Ophiocordyceps polyrhachis-furcata BCC 54312]|uniref:Hyaluronate lyase n=1 Tax=Ophiocordyceps polyrhachis-furcata BCC 54312 TaxID=1330021 RepID=A0A367L2W0_9HYPO|nr:hypothetical protein L249_4812 [Ophiocordyceps polyrhachis-furcata BCC 54312]
MAFSGEGASGWVPWSGTGYASHGWLVVCVVKRAGLCRAIGPEEQPRIEAKISPRLSIGISLVLSVSGIRDERRKRISIATKMKLINSLFVLLAAVQAIAGPPNGKTRFPPLLMPWNSSTVAYRDRFDQLRQRWSDMVLGIEFRADCEPFKSRLASLGGKASRYLDDFSPSCGMLWKDIPYVNSPSARVTQNFRRLSTMAQAWAQPGTGLTSDPQLLYIILRGVDQLLDEVYNECQPPYGNWWNWQIGIPAILMDLCAVLHDELGSSRIRRLVAANNHFVPMTAVDSYVGTSTGANRIGLCQSLTFSGVFGKTGQHLYKARDGLLPVFRFVTSGDGFYADGSFIQHKTIPYTGTYGSVLINGVAKLSALLADSDWAVKDDRFPQFLETVERSFAPVIFGGLVMDGVSGRAVSRHTSNDHSRGHSIMESILLLTESVSKCERKIWWKAMIKGWMSRDRYAPVLSDTALSIAELARLQRLADDELVPAAAEPSGHWVMARMDRVVHRRSTWAASVSMASVRTSFYETGNGENKRGWHTNSGMLYWWAPSSSGQYSNGYWPTVDPYRLPGTSVSRKQLDDGAGGAWGGAMPDAEWVGGVTDGEVGVTGQDVRGLDSSLRGRKSWFFVDDMIICLGAGISSRDGHQVETTMDNRNLGLAGTHVLTVDGRWISTRPGRQEVELVNATWAHLQDSGGYLFLDAEPVQALRETRTGRWRDINDDGDDTPITRRYLTLYRRHGVDPTNGHYAYAVLPGATEEDTRAAVGSEDTRAAVGSVTVVDNGPDRQAVRVGDVFAVNLFVAGATSGLRVSAPCSVLIRGANISVADPTRRAATVDISWQGKTRTVDLAGKEGGSVVL